MRSARPGSCRRLRRGGRVMTPRAAGADPRDRGSAPRRRDARRPRHGPAGPRRPSARPDARAARSSTRSTSRASAAPCSTGVGDAAGARRPDRRPEDRRRRAVPARSWPRASGCFRFPDDPDLPGLAAATDPERPARRPCRSALPGRRRRRVRCRVDLVRYRPGKRATLRCEVRGPRSGAAQRLVVKSYHDGRQGGGGRGRGGAARRHARPGGPAALRAGAGAPARAVARRAGARARRAPRRAVLRVRRTVGRTRRCGGPPSRSPRCTASRWSAAGRARSTPSWSASAPGAPGWPRSTRNRGGTASTSRPASLADGADASARGAVGLVHGDCKPSQFLLRGDRTSCCSTSTPAGGPTRPVDVGTFLATLRQRTVRMRPRPRAVPTSAGGTDGARREECSSRSTCGRRERPPDGELRRRIAWYEAVALERKALRCFARAPRSPLTGALVEEGHACPGPAAGDGDERAPVRDGRRAGRHHRAGEAVRAAAGGDVGLPPRASRCCAGSTGVGDRSSLGAVLLLRRGAGRRRGAHPDRLPHRLPAGPAQRPCATAAGRRSAGRSGPRRWSC